MRRRLPHRRISTQWRIDFVSCFSILFLYIPRLFLSGLRQFIHVFELSSIFFVRSCPPHFLTSIERPEDSAPRSSGLRIWGEKLSIEAFWPFQPFLPSPFGVPYLFPRFPPKIRSNTTKTRTRPEPTQQDHVDDPCQGTFPPDEFGGASCPLCFPCSLTF